MVDFRLTDPLRGRFRPAEPAAGAAQPAGAAADRLTAAVERGRIASLGGVTTLIWLVILVLMAWH